MTPPLPLPSLLSQALVAFTIEVDNAFEAEMPHRTTRHGSTGGPTSPWLVSLVMWSNCLQYVPAEGITAGELYLLAGVERDNLATMLKRLGPWWGYLKVGPSNAEAKGKAPRADWLVRPTPAGSQAQEVWRPLPAVVEERWRDRYEVSGLRPALETVVEQLDADLPDYLPIQGLRFESPRPPVPRRGHAGTGEATMPALLSKVLLTFSRQVESQVKLRMAVGANVLRVLDEAGVRLRDLPRLTGVAKGAVATSVGLMSKRGFVVEAPGAGRFKQVQLTPAGEAARRRYDEVVAGVEESWRTRFGADAVSALGDALSPLVGADGGGPSPLLAAVEAPAPGWRASLPKLETLPHYPVVSPAGGFPDGS